MRLHLHHPENNYLKLVYRILEQGVVETGRNGKTRTLIGETLRFSLLNNTLPLLTTKRVAWKTCLTELLWFIRGDTSNRNLQRQGVHIWDKNSTREFLDSHDGPAHMLQENDLGPIYGHQWRFFNAPYQSSHTDYRGQGVDQLQGIIDNLKDKDKHPSRRLILSAWNPVQLSHMALPPCHVLSQFHVTEQKYLSCTLYQRSGDIGLGVPFNIASYSFLTHLLAHHCNLIPKEFIHFIGNAHIYDDHEEPLRKQLKNTPKKFPLISIINQHEAIDDYTLKDIQVIDYDHHPTIKMEMRP